MTLDDVLDGLTAERYGHSTWWATPKPERAHDDELTCARRRRELLDALDQHEEGTA